MSDFFFVNDLRLRIDLASYATYGTVGRALGRHGIGELEVFRGAAQALARGQIRDIIFEDFSAPPTPVGQYLAGHGFTLFGLCETWWKPRLTSLTDAGRSQSFNYLATRDPSRAKKRFRGPGWKCLMNAA